MDPTGTIVFTAVGRPNYGFDVFSVTLNPANSTAATEQRLTDGISINYNAQFVDKDQSIVFISERTGSPRIYLSRPGQSKPDPLPSVPESLFHDRPVIKNNCLYYISAHENPGRHFQSWSALYAVEIGDEKITRLTPYGEVDFSPAVSESGKFIAVASYGSRPWGGEFHELNTEIVVFPESDPENRILISGKGGWPSWSGDSAVYFHRQGEDGWWSIFRVEFAENPAQFPIEPVRITPPGLHCFTPAAFHDGKRIAVATRRRESNYRHIEIFDLESKEFHSITGLLNPNLHHYNPFVSPDSVSVGYHRFRGESTQGETTIPHLEPISSPIRDLRLLRLFGAFASFSPDGDLIAFNREDLVKGGVNIVKSDGSKRWTFSTIKDRMAFCNSWSPTEENVIYSSLGPIFQSAKTTVQIGRITFDPSDLNDDCEEIPCDVKILTKEETGNNAFPSCSPDGKSIVFRSGRSGHKNLYILDAVNGEFNGGIRQLTNGSWIDTMPNWSPRGDLIAFSSNMHNPADPAVFSIYVIKPDGSDLRRIPVAGPEGSDEVNKERINHVCFSRDGEWLVFTANLGGVTAEPVSWPNQFQPFGDLYVMRLDGSGSKRLTCNGFENGVPAWYPGGEVDMERLTLDSEVGAPLKGDFVEPLWITCDI